MTIKIGCDLVSVKRFKRSLTRGGRRFLDKIFYPSELNTSSKIETLAGIFAAKEAIIKALGWQAGDWKKIEIKKNTNGRPKINILGNKQKILSGDLSISHDGDNAIAVAVFLCS